MPPRRYAVSDSDDESASESATPGVPSDEKLEKGLRDTVAKIYKAGNMEELTVKRVRLATEKALGLEEGFFKADAQWKEESDRIIKEEVVSGLVYSIFRSTIARNANWCSYKEVGALTRCFFVLCRQRRKKRKMSRQERQKKRRKRLPLHLRLRRLADLQRRLNPQNERQQRNPRSQENAGRPALL